MQNGSRKSCLNFMNIALERPNDNSLAQAEWLLGENRDLSLCFGNYDYLKNKAEADSRYAYFKDDFKAALCSGIDWIADYPFDPNPIYFSAEMAYTFVKDYETAIDIINLGLRANSNDAGLLNNLAYCYALSGNLEEAESILDRVDIKSMSLSNETKICLIATRGLVEYRKGVIENGYYLYMQAITKAKELGCEYIYAGDMDFMDPRRFDRRGIRYAVPLEGDYQAENLTSVLACLDLLSGMLPEGRLTDETIREGLLSTSWPGRMERRIFEGKPLLLDGAHNPDGASKLAGYLGKSCPKNSVTLVFSALGKKDVSGILGLLRDCPAVRKAIFTRIHGEVNEDRFISIWQEGKGHKPFETVPEPLEALKHAAAEIETDLVVCAGSLYLIGEIMGKTEAGGSDV